MSCNWEKIVYKCDMSNGKKEVNGVKVAIWYQCEIVSNTKEDGFWDLLYVNKVFIEFVSTCLEKS